MTETIIGGTVITHEPDTDEYHEAFLQAGWDMLHDPRLTKGMMFDGRPLTNLEMLAMRLGDQYAWPAIIETWIAEFESFVEGIEDDHTYQTAIGRFSETEKVCCLEHEQSRGGLPCSHSPRPNGPHDADGGGLATVPAEMHTAESPGLFD